MEKREIRSRGTIEKQEEKKKGKNRDRKTTTNDEKDTQTMTEHIMPRGLRIASKTTLELL